MIEIALAEWSDVWPEIEPLLRAHREEVEPGVIRPFDLATELVELMASADQMIIHQARDGRKLVGYLFWFLSPALDSASTIMANMGPWYVLPELRSTTLGARVWHYSIEHLKSKKIRWILPHVYAESSNAESIRSFYARQGARPLETTYLLDLEAR